VLKRHRSTLWLDLRLCVIAGERKLRLRLFEMQIYCEFLRHNSGSLSLLVVRLNVHRTRNV